MVNKEKIIGIVTSKLFKKITFFTGIIFIIFSLVISFKPEPFLRFSYPGIFIFNMIGGSGVLLVPSLVRYFNLWGIAFATAAGMGVNDSIAWLVGNSGQAIVEKGKKIKLIEKGINKYGMVALFFWSLIPFPYDLIGFVSGYLGMSYLRYIIPTFLGKFVRIILLGFGIISIIK